MVENRLIGMSLNLSKDVFQGAVFQLRDRYSKRILHETANTGCGDAIIFRLADHLQHRNTEVTGTAPKTAFAGWFRSHQPGYHAWIRGQKRRETASPFGCRRGCALVFRTGLLVALIRLAVVGAGVAERPALGARHCPHSYLP